MIPNHPAKPPLAFAVWMGCLIALLVASAGPTGAEDATTATANALKRRYERASELDDFQSFTRRTSAIRQMGTLDCPTARRHLMTIARTSRSIDDRIVAFAALGAKLTPAEAKALAEIAAHKRDPLLTQALTHAFALADAPATRTWLATGAFGIRQPHTLQAIVDVQILHADPRARPRLHAVFVQHRDKERGVALAHGALRALGTIADPRDRRFLLNGPRLGDWRLRLAGAETIARQKPIDINVRAAIVRYMNDESHVVREAALECTGQTGIVELTANVADRLLDPHVRTREVAHAALVAMHEKDLGWDPADWKRWWSTRRDVPNDIQPQPSSSVTSYYGVTVRSDRLLFIVDLSGSMAFPWGATIDKTRIGVAKAQLIRTIERLAESSHFNVIVFSDDVRSWQKKGEVAATPKAKADARAWIDRVFEKPEGGTFMHAALETAFEQNPKVDTIFLLTDGLATDGEPIVPEAILASVNRWNRFRRVVIHTFALTLEDLASDGVNKQNLRGIEAFMRRLASVTGGEYRVVKKPPTNPK